MSRAMIRAVMPLLLLLSAPARAQDPGPSVALQSYREARAVLDAAVAAHGGEAALRRLSGVERRFDLRSVDPGQQRRRLPVAPDPAHMPTAWAADVTVVVDYSGTRLVRIDRFVDGPGDTFSWRQAGDSTGGFSVGTFREAPPFFQPRSPAEFAETRRAELRFFPEALMREAFDRAATLERLPSLVEGGRHLDLVSYADAQGQRVLLGFDGETHLLVRTETLRDHPLYGDTAAELVFSDYRRVGSLMLPFHAMTRNGGIPAHDFAIREIRLDPEWDAGWFEHPTSFVAVKEPPAEPVLRALGGGVYAILGAYNVMFAVFDDYVLLVEAPVDAAFVAACYRLISSVAPGKPVRVVSTHFHSDHVGGVRYAVARGSPVWAPEEARVPIEQSLASQRTLSSVPAAPSASLDFHPIANRAEFSDGAQRVLLYDVGPTPHAAHMLVAWFPRVRALLVADLWDVLSTEMALGGVDAEILMARLRRLHVDFDLMVPVHGVPATRPQLEGGLAVRARYVPPLDVNAWTRGQARSSLEAVP